MADLRTGSPVSHQPRRRSGVVPSSKNEEPQDLRGSVSHRLGEIIVLDHRGQRTDRAVVLQARQGVEGLVSLRLRR